MNDTQTSSTQTSDSLRDLGTFNGSLGSSLFGAEAAFAAPRNHRPHKGTALIGSLVMAGAASVHGQAQTDDASNGDSPIELPPEVTEGRQVQLKSPKFTAPLRDVPQLVNVIPSNVIEQQQATSLRDVLRNSPGITFQAGEGGSAPGDNLFIRGFSAENDIYVNGFRNTGQYARDSFNLEQVEVAKGPSSAIGGRGTTGGAVNLVTKQPYQKSQIQGSVSYGSEDHKRTTLDANQVISEENGVAVRLNAMWDDGGVPGRDAVENSRWGIAPSLAFGLGDATQAVISYQHLQQDNIPDYGQPADAAFNDQVDRENFYGLVNRDYEEIESDQATAELTHAFGEGLTLRNLTHYSKSTREAIVTAPRFVSDSDDMVRRTDVKAQDREFEFLGNQTNVTYDFRTGKIAHTLSSGFEVSTEEYTNYGRDVQAADGYPLDTSLYDPNPNDPYEGTNERDGTYSKGTGDTVALYAFDSIKLTKHWQVTGGLRYENFDAESEDVGEDETTKLEREDDMVSWRAALLYKPTTPVTLYAGAATSFNPSAEGLTLSTGGGRRGSASNNPELDPEKSRNYEAGVKWEPANRGFMVGASVFRTEKTNARTRLDRDEEYVLDGEQVVQGIELSVSGKITNQWSVYGGYSYLDTEVSESLSEDEEGHELAYAPDHAFSIWTTYQILPQLQIGGGAQYSGSYYYSSTSDDSSVPDGTEYWLFNAMASYQLTDNLALRFNVENLADEEYIERGYGGHYTPGRERNYTLTASFRY
ncbi:MAG: iron complex outermembrane recepter protein [Puniceicoccaceae bacterium 5H]|nr:MAG: iron complex outermembrane recepter protein [Puniceicoccaceae bacterium 5H]